MVLAQTATYEKSNEITAVPKLLQMLSLKDAISSTMRKVLQLAKPSSNLSLS